MPASAVWRWPRVAAVNPLAWGIMAGVALGFAIRASYVFGAPFPLNDGGLFYAMTRDLQAAHFVLPATTSYNGSDIPYAYSPLAFYLAGLTDSLTPLALIDVFRFMPLVITSASVGAVALLACEMRLGRIATVAAVVGFAVAPRSFIWLLMGGGVTRSLGMLFAILAVWASLRLGAARRTRWAVIAGFALGLVALSHLGTMPFACLGVLLAFGARNRSLRGAAHLAVLGVVALCLVMPWLVLIVHRHGLSPLEDSMGSGESLFHGDHVAVLVRLARLDFGSTVEPLFPVVNALGILGGLFALARRRWLLPAWWGLTVMFDARAGATYTTVPIALLAGSAVAALVEMRPRLAAALSADGRWVNPAVVPAVACLVVAAYVSFAAFKLRDWRLTGEGYNLESLTPAEVGAMRWIEDHTRPDARFLVLTAAPWASDRSSEWFPALTERKSLGTVQGTEWLDNDAFDAAQAEFNALQSCAQADARCLEAWARQTHNSFDYVYIPAPTFPFVCCAPLFNALMSDESYDVAYAKGGWVFKRRELADAAESIMPPAAGGN